MALAANRVFRYNRDMPSILKLKGDDEAREREFELDYLRSLSVEQRFRMVLEISTHLARTLLDRGHRKSFELVKRS